MGALSLFAVLSACGEDEDGDNGDGKNGGSGGTAGASGAGGSSAGVMNGGRAGSSTGGTSGTGAGAGGAAGASTGGAAGTSAGDGGAGDGGAGDGGDAGDGGAAGSAMGGAGAGGAGAGGAGAGGAGAGGAGMGGAGMGGAGMGGAGMGGAGMGGAGMGGAGMGGAGMAGVGGGGSPAINLYFSEYYEGTATPQQSAVEIYNAGTSAADLTQCTVRVYQNGNGNFTSINLITTLQPAQVYVVCSAQSVSGNCDQSNATMGQVTGNDVVAIVCNSAFQDVIGQIGNNPASGEWGTGNTSTANNTIRRSCIVTTGDRNGTDTFTVSPTDWSGLPATTNDLGGRFCVN